MTDSGDSGSMAPQFLIVLFFASAVAAATTLLVSQLTLAERRAIARDSARTTMVQVFESALADLKSDPTPAADTPSDPFWAWNGRVESGMRVSIRSLSSSINPNFARKGIFEKTPIGNLLKNGKSADDLQQWRESHGLAAGYAGYADFFEQEDFDANFSCYGWLNINIVDEFAARSLAHELTGSEATAESMRQRVRDLLASQRLVVPANLRSVLGADYESLYPFVNAEPLVNVNFASQFVLESILAYPDFGVENPKARAKAIIDLRDGGGITHEQIQGILGIDKNARLYYYVGAITWFWEIRVEGAEERLIAVVCRIPPDAISTSTAPVFKTIELRFER